MLIMAGRSVIIRMMTVVRTIVISVVRNVHGPRGGIIGNVSGRRVVTRSVIIRRAVRDIPASQGSSSHT
jgi:hypothetical protein